ncbi:mpp10 protein [Sarocladium implicatum]|nr:mpp10 protein [Sarocladium implicatum]
MAAGNESTSPTLTSTSHTLSGQSVSVMPSITTTSSSTDNAAVLALLESLRPDNRHAFLQPTASIPTNSLELVKKTLESFAPQVGDEQQRRLQESRKRKRKGQDDGIRGEDVLKMRKVYVDGFETSQVWQQAKKIIHGVLAHSQTALDEMEERQEAVMVGGDDDEVPSAEAEDEEALGTDEELVPEDEEIEGLSEDEDMDGELLNGEEDFDEEDDEAELDDGAAEEDEEDDEEEEEEEEDGQEFVEDPHGLNDGFFSIDDFNKQTQWFEDQDARGDPNTDMASDDEEIDWTADPMAPQPKSAKSKKSRDDASDDGSEDAGVEEEDSDDEDDGPRLKDMDLDAPEGDSEEEDFDAAIEDPEDEEGANANEIYYKDFFAPPQKKNTGKPRKSVSFKPKEPAEGDVERAMEDVKRDLFEDSDEEDMSDDDLSDASAGDPKSRRSAHERRQAKLAEEIRKLEAASVAKREWTLSGEAAAEDRPLNSLLEEDLDFEHGGKPVPVITPEITEDIESMIKRRILAQEFDEVLRRRPDADVPHDTRRGLVAVDDKKSDRGLADLYEEEHVKNSNPDTYVSASDEQLRKEEKEVETLWKSVSAQLDALSSWHYKPKPAAPAISVVADVATVAMEDAQPATAQGVSASDSRLAPQEVYKANNGGKSTTNNGEVITKGGAPLAREEMSREEKARMRRREKERVRKAGGKDAASGKKPLTGRAKMKADTVADLKKGGVMVINRKGELTDVQGNKPKAAKAMSSGNYKL